MLQVKTDSKSISEVLSQDIWGSIKEVLNWGLHLGEGDHQVHITLGLLLLILASFLITNFVLKWIRRLSTRKMNETDTLKFISVFRFIKYVVYIIVVFAVLSFAGVNITPFLAASAALFVGLGLALQELFQDIIAGILIMVDKSLLVGDIIEVEGRVGKVIDIKLRTTRAITRDDKVVIIPNHKFISNSLYNYTQNHPTTREFVSVGVAYGSDTQKVKQILLACAAQHPEILKKPEPFVFFEDFADSSLNFSLFFSIADSFTDPRIKSDLRFQIDKAFREEQINIPFPQRDVHIIQKSN